MSYSTSPAQNLQNRSKSSFYKPSNLAAFAVGLGIFVILVAILTGWLYYKRHYRIRFHFWNKSGVRSRDEDISLPSRAQSSSTGARRSKVPSTSPSALAEQLAPQPPYPRSSPPYIIPPPSQAASLPDDALPAKVNARYQRMRDANYERKIGQGFAESQAQSMSEGTGLEDDIDPLAHDDKQAPFGGGRSKYAILTENVQRAPMPYVQPVQKGKSTIRMLNNQPIDKGKHLSDDHNVSRQVKPKGWLSSPEQIRSAVRDLDRGESSSHADDHDRVERGWTPAPGTETDTRITEDQWGDELQADRRKRR
ncbi:MAG: hypothetical protein M1825_003736 [Sarcosagium campestre]|nr:MAG: hypothetical protein M1825_003736 [Sarcosagium campestre]